MTQEQQEKHFEQLMHRMKEVLLKKGNDYANADRLSNFKLAGNICGMPPELNCLNLIATKVARLGVLLQDVTKPANNESVRDSVLDMANYTVLLDMILGEKEAASKSIMEHNAELTKAWNK